MLFAGINIVGTGYFGAIGNSFWSSALSILRGIIVIIVSAVVLARLFGMNGVWLAFPVTELIVMALTIVVLLKEKKK